MRAQKVSFSIAAHAAWAPGIDTPEAWAAWAALPFPIVANGNLDPGVRQMPTMLRRRAGFLGKMALEVAYQCLGERRDVPTVFCSRHGDVARAVELLTDLALDVPLSPTGFGLAVHNASAGLFSIARNDAANHVALAAGTATIEHGVIEACGLLADGAPMVLLVAYDNCLAPVFAPFADCAEQPHAWAWLMTPAAHAPVTLCWHAADPSTTAETAAGLPLPGSLAVLQFQVRGASALERVAEGRCWRWSHAGHAA
jgi:hypothetical protein